MPKPGPRTTTRYSDEFKATAVRLSALPGVRVQDIAASLYIGVCCSRKSCHPPRSPRPAATGSG